MLNRNYELYTYLTKGEKRVTSPRLIKRFWTLRGAENYGRHLVCSPTILAQSLKSATQTWDGGMVWANYEVKDIRTDTIVARYE